MSMVVCEKSLLCPEVTFASAGSKLGRLDGKKVTLKQGKNLRKSNIGLQPVAYPVDRISLGASGRMLVLLASSSGRWPGNKGGRPAEASLVTL